MTERAVSETLGFILVFALITSTIGVVYTSGISGLKHARDAEQLENMERAFDVLDENIGDIQDRGAPSRATEIKLSGGTFRFGSETQLTVTVNGTPYRTQSDPIEYASGDGQRIAYDAGATIRIDRTHNASTMLDEPPMRFDSDRAVIQFVGLRPKDETTVGGSTTTLIRTEYDSSRVLLINSSSPTVTFDVNTTSARAPAWKRYLESNLPSGYVTIDGNPDDGRLEYQFTTDHLVVSRMRVQVAFT